MSKGESLRPGFGLLPRTRAGWIALWLTAAFAACFGGAQAVIAARGVNEANPWLSIFGLGGFVLALAAGVAAAVAMVRHDEHSLLLGLPTVIGVVAMVFILGELFVPH